MLLIRMVRALFFVVFLLKVPEVVAVQVSPPERKKSQVRIAAVVIAQCRSTYGRFAIDCVKVGTTPMVTPRVTV